MSFMHRPRAIINGVRRTRTYRFFWCRQCDRTVRIASSSDPHNFICPLCYSFLRQELHISRPNLTLQQHGHTSSAAQLLDTMAQMLEPPSFPRIRSSTALSQPIWNPPRPASSPDNALPRDENVPPPSSSTSEPVESMPVVRVTADILDREPTCPVCKEDFLVDEQIRKMPCSHFYHSDCITPWLQIHNTCPVCRYQIPMPQRSDNEDNSSSHFRAADTYSNYNDDADAFRFEDVMNFSWPSLAELFSLWPFRFRSLRNWSFQDHDDSLNDTASSSSASSWWRYLMIL